MRGQVACDPAMAEGRRPQAGTAVHLCFIPVDIDFKLFCLLGFHVSIETSLFGFLMCPYQFHEGQD